MYFLTVLLFLAAVLLVFGVNTIEKVNVSLENKSNDLSAQERRYDYTAIQNNANNIRNIASRLELDYYDIDTASRRLLTYSDYLFQRYGAEIVEGIIVEPAQLRVNITFVYQPVDVYDFIVMLQDLLQRGTPATYIDKLVLKPDQEYNKGYYVECNLVVTHPYLVESDR
jgi:hypothetical protein